MIIEKASVPLRSRKDVLLLLLYTIRVLVIDHLPPDSNSCIGITISKMSRIFYSLENKIFSVRFPFGIEQDEDRVKRVYDVVTKEEIDTIFLSNLIEIFENLRDNCGYIYFLEMILEIEKKFGENYAERVWTILRNVLTCDLGYLRYECDDKHQKGQVHPLYHLDVYLDNPTTFKIGLDEDINLEMFKNILDVTTNCYYLRQN